MAYLACDLGAESGRLMAGELGARTIQVREIHRFPNTPLRRGESLHWDLHELFEQLKSGLRQAAALNLPFKSISTDSWGLDYALFDEAGAILEPVFHYRDPRTAAGIERVAQRLSPKEIFSETGIQFMAINSIYQLAAEEPARLRAAHRLLFIADAFNFLLSGVSRAEESLASTTQLYNPVRRHWSRSLLEAVDIPERLLPEIVPCGSRLGQARPEITRQAGLPPLEVVASCSHDTAAAVVAVPAAGDDWGYISSGTWSLLGVELPAPILTEGCRELNFTNEAGYGGTIRLLKNIIGLWIVQECRREWASQGRVFDYAELTALAEGAEPFRSLIQPADPRFFTPDGMAEKIAGYCRETDQPAPRTPGETIRCALESLALLYQKTARELETLTRRSLRMMHIVGGGSRNVLLNQFAANALGIPVAAGPVEATTTGNVLVQAITAGELDSLARARDLVCNSIAVQRFEPRDAPAWEAAQTRFERLP